MNMRNWYDELERISVPTVTAAKRAACAIDCGIWKLPSGRYIASQQGPVMPPESMLVAKRTTPGGRWREVAEGW